MFIETTLSYNNTADFVTVIWKAIQGHTLFIFLLKWDKGIYKIKVYNSDIFM